MSKSTNHEKKLTWWQMSFIGVGCIIGTGYFLGSSITIEKAGYLVLLAYFLAAIGTWIVYEALAKLTAEHPEKGSFRTYAKQAFGQWAGFSNGWVYWSSEMLIMGSQLTALALFAQFWFPNAPLWLSASVFASLGLIVILIGVQLVEKMENVFGVMKIAAIVMFLAIGIAALLGWLEPQKGNAGIEITSKDFLTGSAMGLWVALVYAFYAFGGIEVMGLMANELEDPKNAPKAGKIMLLVLTILYVMSFFVVLKLIPIKSIDPNESPFLTALTQFHLPWIPHVFNAILIIAGFSTMVASLYAVTTMLVTLAEENDAPALFAKKSRKIPLPAFGLTTLVVLLSIVVALLLPENIFEYLTTAAGLMLLYNWMFILFSYRKLTKTTFKDHLKIGIGVVLIGTAISGTLFDKISRAGFLVSLCFLVLIAGATFLKMKRKHS
ncbi:amino acid permease [Alkalihalobacillus hwajinpoensis]|uniref:amino acid permease n=1 Tax=Guptibacillus hwajinpoensis TaxID=208199 RepID=UPI0018838406|nr:amino acid permease [Pseudalkalibacillus hwajinpoensis]MBF0709522.1 amino acid permease [Pseudalkalibacillus hwajinpoensis]